MSNTAMSPKRLGGKYVTRGIELTVTTKTDKLNGGKSVSFHSEDGGTTGGMWFRDGVVTRAKIQARLDAEELATCAECGRPHLQPGDRNRRFHDVCDACRAASWKAQEEAAARERDAARQAQRAEHNRFWNEFHEVAEMRPLPAFGMLRDVILANNPKRCPKWTYRLAPDLVVELQPRPTLAEWHRRTPQPAFLGRAFFHAGGAGVELFEARRADLPREAVLVKFELSFPPEGGAWRFRCDTYLNKTGQPGMEVVLAVRRRLLAEIPARLRSLCPDVMLRYHCLVCGKALTDPASQARFIGPECWGSSTLSVPETSRGRLSLWLARQAGFDLADPTARLVAADWLEERGDEDTARALRGDEV
jgi:hypothetical protein